MSTYFNGHMIKFIYVTFSLLSITYLLMGSTKGKGENLQYDVCVYGATPSGIAASVAAARNGVSVLLVEEANHIGGLITSGMSNPDFKTFEALAGFYKEYMQRVVDYYSREYGPESQQLKDCFHGVWYEPKVAYLIFHEMLENANVKVLPGYRLQTAKLKKSGLGNTIDEAVFVATKSNANKNIRAKVFIDATYEGDLMAMAGCDYRVGRESRKEYGELFAGVKYYSEKNFLIGSTGVSDHKIQCYNFRICMTDDPQNRLPIEKPKDYNSNEFARLSQLLGEGKIEHFDQLVGINRVPNRKADFNDKMYSLVSLRLPGENYDWPNGNSEARKKIFDRHKSYSLAFLYFIQNDSSVPENIQTEARQWGLPADEFQEYGHFPPMVYVREARRLKSMFVLTEADLLPSKGSVRSPLYTDAIAICDYSMDSHGNAPPSNLHPDITEGVFNYYVVPYQLPYRVLVPNEVEQLLVTCAVSASHVAFSSLRMEPTWCALGQAAGIAAALAVKNKQMVRNINVEHLQNEIYKQKGMTVYISDVQPGSPIYQAVQYFGTKGFFHDLPEYKNVPYIGRGKSLGRGQFIEKYPYHEINPDWDMDEKLAESWLKLAGLPSGSVAYKNVSRGDFLLNIFKTTNR